jgi:hypothetical protein
VIVLPLRAFVRVVAFLLLVALAALGLATAIFSLQGDSNALSLPKLAVHFRLPQLEDVVGDYLSSLERGGPTAWISVGAGAAAVALGLALLVGALAPRRERLLVLEEEDGSVLAARRRPLTQIACALAEQERGVTVAKATIRSSRWRAGGGLRLTAFHPRNRAAEEIASRARSAVEPLGDAFNLRTRVRPRLGERGRARVQ